MEAVFALGRAVQLARIEQEDPALLRLLNQTAVSIIHFHARIDQFVSWVESRLRNSSEEGLEIPGYEETCRWRSALEFLRTLYGASPYGEYLKLLDTEDLDADLRHRSELLGISGHPPEGIPIEHWWCVHSQ